MQHLAPQGTMINMQEHVRTCNPAIDEQATGEQATGEQAPGEQTTGKQATGATSNRCIRTKLSQRTSHARFH